jgi:hypothetical protein
MCKLLLPHETWNIGIVREPISAFLQPHASRRIEWFYPLERGKFLADPFGVFRSETLYVFCEEYDYLSQKGRIVYVTSSRENRISKPALAIDLPHHISYPFLLEYQGETYCIPETWQARKISLYKAQQFPRRWTKIATLVDNFAGVDSTVFMYDGGWWLACTDQNTGRWDKLFLWYASDIVGPWSPHEANPVKIDIRSSRPAGTPFIHDDCLYRPAQDCSLTYGGRIVLNRIVTLTPTQFREEPAGVIESDANGPYPDGVHTLSAVGDITLIDGKRLASIKSTIGRATRSHLARR